MVPGGRLNGKRIVKESCRPVRRLSAEVAGGNPLLFLADWAADVTAGITVESSRFPLSMALGTLQSVPSVGDRHRDHCRVLISALADPGFKSGVPLRRSFPLSWSSPRSWA